MTTGMRILLARNGEIVISSIKYELPMGGLNIIHKLILFGLEPKWIRNLIVLAMTLPPVVRLETIEPEWSSKGANLRNQLIATHIQDKHYKA